MRALVVWFDGGCPLCRREIALMQRLDRAEAIRFIDIAVEQAGCPIDAGVLLSRFHVLEDGRLLSGAAGFAAMWRAIPRLRPLGLAAEYPLVLTILEWLYRRFLRVRPRLQQWARWIDDRSQKRGAFRCWHGASTCRGACPNQRYGTRSSTCRWRDLTVRAADP